MGDSYRLFLLLTVFVIGINSFSRRSTFNPFPLGTIGCLMSDVCDTTETCMNEYVFGRCQNIFIRPEINEYQIEPGLYLIKILEDEVLRLLKSGFSWKDALTQCTLQNMLFEFHYGRIFNRYVCQEALDLVPQSSAEDRNNQIAKVFHDMKPGDLGLKNILGETGIIDRDFDLLNSKKRDEIIQIHKYFDQSGGQSIQNPFFEFTPDVYLNEDSTFNSLYHSQHIPHEKDNYKNIFINTGNRNDLLSYDPHSLTENSHGVAGISKRKLSDQRQFTMEQNAGPPVRQNIQPVVFGPEDEETLEKLLEGKISPRDLDIMQQNRLQLLISNLIQALANNVQNIELLVEADKDVQGDESVSPQGWTLPEKVANLDSSNMKPVLGGYPDYLGHVDRENGGHEQQKLPNKDTLKGTHVLQEDGGANEELQEPRLVDHHHLNLKLSNEVGAGRMIGQDIRTDHNNKWDAQKITIETDNVDPSLEKRTGIAVNLAGYKSEDRHIVEVKQDNSNVVLTVILVGTITGVLLVVVSVFLFKRNNRSKTRLTQIANIVDGKEASKDYQDLCRQHMQGRSSDKSEPLHDASGIGCAFDAQVRSPSSRGSASSWSEEPAASNMDIFTGHIVLSYMEDHLKNQDRLDHEWEAVMNYEPDPCSTKVANDQGNMRKNRFADILPYDHSRVILSSNVNVSNSDYINASYITDHDPRNPAYISTQGPLPHTVADFWQMIWEQGSVVIIMLTRLVENGVTYCHRYWPEEGADLYHIYEVHLVSEHIWCDDYLVRSFYLKNLQTSETRTVTQFHFLTWPDLSVPASIKTLLDFRRKVNKSFRARCCPIVVHCSDGSGRAGTYCLIDMVLNKMSKGAKEIDMAATLEHIRDQRMSMVKTKEQFQFSLAAVAEEVHAILKALPQ